MKKALFVAFAAMALCLMPSCKKTCTCTYNYEDMGVDKLETSKEFPTCQDIEDYLNAAGAGIVIADCK